ncbi:MAG: gamma-glutamyl-phosphate reductase, partial [Cypionkella sp.]|nr:gamma-glutamyl-phosphate reductase [Cypionkella sp.]
MDGQILDVMRDIGSRARAAAAELAYASQERKYAALIGASAAVWARRQDILDANYIDMDYATEK